MQTYTLTEHLDYISDPQAKSRATRFLEECQKQKPGLVTVDPIQAGISLKAKNKVFAYLLPRKKHMIIGTYDREDEWTEYPVRTEDEYAQVMAVVKINLERKAK